MEIKLETKKLLGFRLYSEAKDIGVKCGGKRGDEKGDD